MNYTMSFKLTSDNTEVSNLNIYHFANDIQKLLKEKYKSNLNVAGYYFEHDKFQPFHPEDFSEEVSQ